MYKFDKYLLLFYIPCMLLIYVVLIHIDICHIQQNIWH